MIVYLVDRAFYVSHLLQEVLHVKPDHLTVMDDTVTWTMGAALVGGYSAKMYGPQSSHGSTLWSSPSRKLTLKSIVGFLGVACLLSLIWRARSRNMHVEAGSLDDSKTHQLPIFVATREQGQNSNPSNQTGYRWGRENIPGMAQRRGSHNKLLLL